MKIDVVMPKMGESLQEGTITKWLKKEGDIIERDEMILEISTDKVDTEVPSPKSGKLAKILVQEGETVEVGEKIAEIETDAAQSTNGESENKSEETKKETSDKQPEAKKEEKQEVAVAEAEDNSTDADESDDPDDIIDVVMPKMGESLQEGTITKWLKKKGDTIERDEMILEISTDKVDTEVPAPVAGVLVDIISEEGETIEVGEVIAKISKSGTAKVKKSAPKKETKSKEESSAKSESATSQAASKSSTSISLPANGGTKEIPARHEDKFFSPLVRNIAEDKGIVLEELMQIEGSGAGGRITKSDILEYAEKRTSSEAKQAKQEDTAQKPKTTEAKAAPERESKESVEEKPKTKQYSFSSDETEVIPMDRVRQLIADHMVYSVNTSPHVTTVAEADVTEIVAYREKHKGEFQNKEGFKLTYTPFFAKAVIEALRKHPMVNVSVDGKNIIRHKRINLGIATALPDGNLIVPVIKKSEELNLTGIARSVNDLASRARNKKLQPDEIQGGTFSITNFGTFGNLFGTPIINQPQTAIMGIGAIQKRPVVKEVAGQDMILIRHMCYVSLTFDHRVIDGMLGGEALMTIVNNLEKMNEDTLSF